MILPLILTHALSLLVFAHLHWRIKNGLIFSIAWIVMVYFFWRPSHITEQEFTSIFLFILAPLILGNILLYGLIDKRQTEKTTKTHKVVFQTHDKNITLNNIKKASLLLELPGPVKRKALFTVCLIISLPKAFLV